MFSAHVTWYSIGSLAWFFTNVRHDIFHVRHPYQGVVLRIGNSPTDQAQQLRRLKLSCNLCKIIKTKSLPKSRNLNHGIYRQKFLWGKNHYFHTLHFEQWPWSPGPASPRRPQIEKLKYGTVQLACPRLLEDSLVKLKPVKKKHEKCSPGNGIFRATFWQIQFDPYEKG